MVSSDSCESEIEISPGTPRSAIIAHLYRHPEQNHALEDIMDALGISREAVTTTLAQLHDDGYIGKADEKRYHALADQRAIRRYVASLDELHRMFGHHRDAGTAPEKPRSKIGGDRTDQELDAELSRLEASLEDHRF